MVTPGDVLDALDPILFRLDNPVDPDDGPEPIDGYLSDLDRDRSHLADLLGAVRRGDGIGFNGIGPAALTVCLLEQVDAARHAVIRLTSCPPHAPVSARYRADLELALSELWAERGSLSVLDEYQSAEQDTTGPDDVGSGATGPSDPAAVPHHVTMGTTDPDLTATVNELTPKMREIVAYLARVGATSRDKARSGNDIATGIQRKRGGAKHEITKLKKPPLGLVESNKSDGTWLTERGRAVAALLSENAHTVAEA